MPLTLELPEDVEAWLQTAARAKGVDVNAFAVAALRDIAKKNADNSLQTVRPGKPIAQFIDEQREKHGFPADWGTGKVAPLTEEEWAEIDSAFADIYPDALDNNAT